VANEIETKWSRFSGFWVCSGGFGNGFRSRFLSLNGGISNKVSTFVKFANYMLKMGEMVFTMWRMQPG
jgi:hypothetical protein